MSKVFAIPRDYQIP